MSSTIFKPSGLEIPTKEFISDFATLKSDVISLMYCKDGKVVINKDYIEGETKDKVDFAFKVIEKEVTKDTHCVIQVSTHFTLTSGDFPLPITSCVATLKEMQTVSEAGICAHGYVNFKTEEKSVLSNELCFVRDVISKDELYKKLKDDPFGQLMSLSCKLGYFSFIILNGDETYYLFGSEWEKSKDGYFVASSVTKKVTTVQTTYNKSTDDLSKVSVVIPLPGIEEEPILICDGCWKSVTLDKANRCPICGSVNPPQRFCKFCKVRMYDDKCRTCNINYKESLMSLEKYNELQERRESYTKEGGVTA